MPRPAPVTAITLSFKKSPTGGTIPDAPSDSDRRLGVGGSGEILRRMNIIRDLVGVDFPLFAFSHCRDVVAAVSRAGGFGVLGGSSYTPETLEVELRWIDE